MSTAPKMVRAAYLAENYGLSARHWIRLAASGKIPCAYQPSGPGGIWLFDHAAFRQWFEGRRRQVAEWHGSAKNARQGGRLPKSPPWSSHTRIDLKATLAEVLRRGAAKKP